MTEEKEMQWLHQLYMQSPIAIGIYMGKDHVIEFANPKMCAIWGRKLEQVLNKPLFEALPEVSGQGFEEILAEVLETGLPFSGNELPATLERNGKLGLAYFNILYEPLRDENNVVKGVIQTASEVTELVESRKKVERNEEFLKLALEAAKMGTWSFDLIQNKLTRSVEHDRVYGHPDLLPEWNHSIFMEQVLPSDREFAMQSFNDALVNGSFCYEVRVQWPDKSIHWVQLKGKTTYNLAHKPISMSGIVMDVTEQRKAAEKERELIASKAAKEEAERQTKILADIFMEAPAMICTLRGPDHVFDLVNPLYQQLFPGRILKGKTVLEAIPELINQPFKDILDRVYETGETYTGKEVLVKLDRYNTKELESVYLNFIYKAMRNQEGKIEGILVFAYEVTEQIEARMRVEKSEEDLRKALNELEVKNNQLMRINNDLDNFIYTASHDLKSPISNLEGLIYAFSDFSMNEDQKQIAGMMTHSIERFKKTIKDLTEITHAQREESEDLQEVNFKDMLEEVLQNIDDTIKRTEARIESAFDISSINFSRKNLRSILYNLVTNAIKYASPERKPEVVVKSFSEGNYTVLTVTDNGLGIPEHQRTKVFGMFKRLHDHVEGSGIGLYIVKRIIDNAGGSIQVESEPGKGSCFKICFRNSE